MQTLRFLSVLALATFSSFGSLAGCASSILGPEGPPPGRALGAACAFDGQCASRRCSGDAELGTCGECVEIRALGESCAGPHQGCSVSAICEDGVCRSTKKVAGEACSLGPKGEDPHDCDDELYCARVDDKWGAGVCAARVPVGGACDDDSSRCVQGASCNAAQECVLPVPGSCGAGYWTCEGGFHCGADLLCHPGTLAEGARCGLVDGSFIDDECVPGLVCGSLEYPNGGGGHGTVTVCLTRPGAGEPCINGACGEGLFCYRPFNGDSTDLPRCEPLRSEGEACRNDNYFGIGCAAGLECRGETCQVACR